MTLPHRPAAVVFDMDGLLFDTEALWQEALLSAAAEAGREIPAEVYDGSIGVRRSQCRGLFLTHFGEDFPFDDFHASWRRHFWRIADRKLALKPGVPELLEVLDQRRLPRAIATSSARTTVERHLAAHGLTDRFDEIVCRGDYENGKPAPDPFLKAAERLGVDPWLCLALEDSHVGVRSAAAAGMMTVMVPDLLAPTEALRGLCVLVARDLHRVRGLVLEAYGDGVDGAHGRHLRAMMMVVEPVHQEHRPWIALPPSGSIWPSRSSRFTRSTPRGVWFWRRLFVAVNCCL